MSRHLTLPLSCEPSQATLSVVGGKGRNLCILTNHKDVDGLSVPQGFVVTTAAYLSATAAITPWILSTAQRLAETKDMAEDPTTYEQIREKIISVRLDDELAESINAQYQGLQADGASVPMAVRSSATAEDLPGISFAGQQDTYLNVVGKDAVMKAVKDCWASLWTPRAIRYRHYHGLGQDDLALAVVIQVMVPSKAAGVLFTANPITGLRSETLVDATLGLGEPLVSGQVVADHFVVSMEASEDADATATSDSQPEPAIISRTLGSKAVVMRATTGGGTDTDTADSEANAGEQWSLTDDQVKSLALLGHRIASIPEFQVPPTHEQDIEWAIGNDGVIHVVQSRPITTLYPLPPRPPNPKAKKQMLMAFSEEQGYFEPYTIVGQETFGAHMLNLCAEKLFGVPWSIEAAREVVPIVGMRMYIDMRIMFGNSLAKMSMMPYSEEVPRGMTDLFRALANDEDFNPPAHRSGVWSALKMAWHNRHWINVALRSQRDAEWSFNEFHSFNQKALDAFQSHLPTSSADHGPEAARAFVERVDAITKTPFMDGVVDICLSTMYVAGAVAGPGQLAAIACKIPGLWARTLQRIRRAEAEGSSEGEGASSIAPTDVHLDGKDDSDRCLSKDECVSIIQGGAPDNPTTMMNLKLWEVSGVIDQHPESRALFLNETKEQLALRYRATNPDQILHPSVQQAVTDFIEEYGFRGYGEIDLGVKPWSEEPDRVMTILKSLLLVREGIRSDPSKAASAPDVQCKRNQLQATHFLAELEASVGFLKRRNVRQKAHLVRRVVGLRESVKFHLSKLFSLARGALKHIGVYLVSKGVLKHQDDVVMLHFQELMELRNCAINDGEGEGAGDAMNLLLTEEQCAHYHSVYEKRRKAIPRVFLTTGRAYYELEETDASDHAKAATSDDANILKGDGVSVGVVEAPARLIRDPFQDGERPGDVMVCMGSDPSWTPLFMTAGGVIMEVGSKMQHGAVVAREMGIPAVVNVGRVFDRFKDGQMVRINGDSGEVVLLDDSASVV